MLNYKTQIRVGNIENTYVTNAYVVYVGRGNKNLEGSPLGNPIPRKPGEKPGSTLERYKQQLWEAYQEGDSEEWKEIDRLAKIVVDDHELYLLCHCSPNPCHAEVIKKAILWYIETVLQPTPLTNQNGYKTDWKTKANTAEARRKTLMTNRTEPTSTTHHAAKNPLQGKRVIFAGSRTATKADCLNAWQTIPLINEATIILSGGAKGTDSYGAEIAKTEELIVEHYPANWDKFGKSAGYRRNEEMARKADALVAVWDGQSKGTQHMINLAQQKGLEVQVYCTDSITNYIEVSDPAQTF